MRRIVVIVLIFAGWTAQSWAQAKTGTPQKKASAPAGKLTLKDLPLEVQKTVQDQAQGAEIKNISRETEHGIRQYEIETVLNGKHRDFNVDTKGALLLVEEETTLESIPAAARATIMKTVGGGKLGMVELFKRDGETMYEAGYVGKDGKRHEILVRADGTITKD